MGSTSSNQMMTGLNVFQGITSFGSALSQSRAHAMQGQYQKQMYEFNSQIAEIQAEDAVDRGEEAVKQHKKDVKQIIGGQRAAFAAQGIEVDSGSAAEIQESTKMMGEMDVMRIRNNAWRESWGYKMDAIGQSMAGQYAGAASKFAQGQTLLGGGLKAVSSGLEGAYWWKK